MTRALEVAFATVGTIGDARAVLAFLWMVASRLRTRRVVVIGSGDAEWIGWPSVVGRS